ncbi:MAG: Branched-chain amino acid aminotransferase [uncultured Campylobacterales bacterium]|uniref:Branched-chain amino acid aminotransferase n=1 Tax=uncultured Campylobacterales bacterium TaxID=352960 RepID=A0A6S6TF60_9BACT|nr:MAG: Branched-chain amino acid aminotransferase [uncultured Campylobacterales bacterium]
MTDDLLEYNYKYIDRKDIDIVRDDFDEVIFIKNNLVTDSSIANIAIKYNDIWITPKIPLLKGTMRESLLFQKKIKLSDITKEMLLESKEIAFMNAMVEFRVISDYDLYT